jgi:dienelactone hydrolase
MAFPAYLRGEFFPPPGEYSGEGLTNHHHRDGEMLRSCCALLVLIVCGRVAGAQGPEGTWVGRCRIGTEDVLVRLHLQRDGTRIRGMAFSRRLGIRVPVTDAETDGSKVQLSFSTRKGAVRLACEIRDGKLEGTAEHGGSSGPCAFRRRHGMNVATFDAFRGNYQLARDRVVYVGRFDTANYFFLADGDLRVEIMPVGPRAFLTDDLRTIEFQLDKAGEATAAVVSQSGKSPIAAPRVRLHTEEDVTFTNGDVSLSGTLTLPRGRGPFAALVFVHGSGAQTRADNTIEADRFARYGIATLAFDKRGTGQSSGDWRQVDFDVLAEDVLAGVRFLRADRRIRADKVGLWGISQAGWVIPLAASRSADVAFIVPISGGAVTPAEQELWRHRQNLEHFGVPERFIDLERRGATMAYQWQRLNQLGRMLIPNVFADDNLNMFHDAAAVLRRVKQPVLAIFGGLDTLTPPRESAAIWADALRQRGDGDYSVRLFPTGTHGLFDGAQAESPFDLIRELRWVPGYFDTTVKWIHHHVDGPPFAEARRMDVDADDIPVESRGMDRVSWYGSGAVQPWALVVSLVVFASAVLAAPFGWLWRRVRRVTDVAPPGARRTAWLAALLGLINVGLLVAMVFVLYQLVQAQRHPVLDHLGVIWNTMAVAAWLSLALVAVVVYGSVAAWRNAWWTRAGRVYYTLVGLVALGWVPFVFYWDLARPIF